MSQLRPYVPVIRYAPATGIGRSQTQQISGKAFTTRDEAVAFAQRVIDADRRRFGRDLRRPRFRVLREQFGLPWDLADLLGVEPLHDHPCCANPIDRSHETHCLNARSES